MKASITASKALTVAAAAAGLLLASVVHAQGRDTGELPRFALTPYGGYTFGGEFKDAMAEPGPWRIGATAFGEMLPEHDNRIELDETRTDKWGLPVLKIDCATGENEALMRRDMATDMAETLEACGARNVRMYNNEYYPGMGIHEMGTARMGRDPATSVLNAHNQVWDAPNVFVTDGSCMTSAACQNPSLTYMALTARAADFAVRELGRRNL